MKEIKNFHITIRTGWSYKPTQEPKDGWVQLTLDSFPTGVFM